VTTILAAVFAALLAGSFALLGARVGHQREHDQWLRNARQEAYEALLVAVNRFQLSGIHGKAAGTVQEQLRYLAERSSELLTAACAVSIAGPAAASDAGNALKATVLAALKDEDGTNAATDQAEQAFIAIARRTLQSDS
jgi:hypothetical protein